jgi:hypothetical protein
MMQGNSVIGQLSSYRSARQTPGGSATYSRNRASLTDCRTNRRDQDDGGVDGGIHPHLFASNQLRSAVPEPQHLGRLIIPFPPRRVRSLIDGEPLAPA